VEAPRTVLPKDEVTVGLGQCQERGGHRTYYSQAAHSSAPGEDAQSHPTSLAGGRGDQPALGAGGECPPSQS